MICEDLRLCFVVDKQQITRDHRIRKHDYTGFYDGDQSSRSFFVHETIYCCIQRYFKRNSEKNEQFVNPLTSEILHNLYDVNKKSV